MPSVPAPLAPDQTAPAAGRDAPGSRLTVFGFEVFRV